MNGVNDGGAAIVHCADCKHWDNDPNAGSCDYKPDGMGSCELIRNNEYKSDGMARTAFGYDLFTRPEFGCVLGERRETRE